MCEIRQFPEYQSYHLNSRQIQLLLTIMEDLQPLVRENVSGVCVQDGGRLIGIATYEIMMQLPEAYREELPSPERSEKRLQLWNNKDFRSDSTDK